ncbi:MAG: hypothetical protein VW270_03965 [Candidatus Poseidoniales archaeon]
MFEQKYYTRTVRISAHDRSLDKLDNESNQNFEVDCPANGGHWSRVHAIKIIAVSIPHSFYNVSKMPDGTNPTFTWSDLSGGPYTVEITPGQYTTNDLIQALGTALSGSVGTAFSGDDFSTSAQDPITGRVTLTSSSGNQFITIESGYYTNRIGYLLGGEDLETKITLIGQSSFTFPYTPRLWGLNAVTVHCPQLGISTVDFDRGSANHFPLVRVPMDVPYNVIAHYQSSDDATNLIVYPSPRGISHIELALRDDRGDIVDINNSDWSIVFKIYYSI